MQQFVEIVLSFSHCRGIDCPPLSQYQCQLTRDSDNFRRTYEVTPDGDLAATPILLQTLPHCLTIGFETFILRIDESGDSKKMWRFRHLSDYSFHSVCDSKGQRVRLERRDY